MSGDWRARFFARRTAVTRLGLIEAPRRATVSNEMLAVRELLEKELAQMREIDQRLDDEIREAERRRQVDALRPLVEEFGAAAVTKLSRRTDPNFQLPPELLDVEDEDK